MRYQTITGCVNGILSQAVDKTILIFAVEIIKAKDMAVAGITVERTAGGRAKYVRIDLRKHADFIPRIAQAKNGEWKEGVL